MKNKKIAIIGASYLQEPLISKAKEMGIETHVFAWQVGDVGEKLADYFYPISIVEKKEILQKCQENPGGWYLYDSVGSGGGYCLLCGRKDGTFR